MTSVFTVIQYASCHILQFQKRAVRIGSCVDMGYGGRLLSMLRLLELGEELGCGALGCAVSQVEN
jgi:hypothetical protein